MAFFPPSNFKISCDNTIKDKPKRRQLGFVVVCKGKVLSKEVKEKYCLWTHNKGSRGGIKGEREREEEEKKKSKGDKEEE